MQSSYGFKNSTKINGRTKAQISPQKGLRPVIKYNAFLIPSSKICISWVKKKMRKSYV